MNSYKIGVFSEFMACMYLRLHGFHIMRRRYVTGRNTGRAEIDIIARVKHRHDVLTGLDAVTPAQSIRLRRAAETYIAQTKWMGDARFDIIVVTPRKIQWFRGVI